MIQSGLRWRETLSEDAANGLVLTNHFLLMSYGFVPEHHRVVSLSSTILNFDETCLWH